MRITTWSTQQDTSTGTVEHVPAEDLRVEITTTPCGYVAWSVLTFGQDNGHGIASSVRAARAAAGDVLDALAVCFAHYAEGVAA